MDCDACGDASEYNQTIHEEMCASATADGNELKMSLVPLLQISHVYLIPLYDLYPTLSVNKNLIPQF